MTLQHTSKHQRYILECKAWRKALIDLTVLSHIQNRHGYRRLRAYV
jgi:hypothetical protein